MDGRYESYYLRAVDPQRPRAAWIRYTTHQRPGETPTGSLWCTYFDGDEQEPYAVKETLPDPARPTGAWIAIGDSTFGPGAARGNAAALGRAAAWDLSITGGEAPLRHLPREWMYRAKLPRTKLESPLPAATFDGLLEIDGRRVELDSWPGMVGHNWGAEHAATWVWLHGIAFGEDAWLDLSAGRVRVGPVLTPGSPTAPCTWTGSASASAARARPRSRRPPRRAGSRCPAWSSRRSPASRSRGATPTRRAASTIR